MVAKKAERQAKASERQAYEQVKNLQSELNGLRSRFAQFEALEQGEKRDRILAAHNLWPNLSGAGIAAVVDSSPPHVSQVLKSVQNGSESSDARSIARE